MMLRTVTTVRQYLAAAFVIVIGLMASGCGDSASVNSTAQLAGLTVTPGTLSPTFSGGTTQYNVNLSNIVTSVTITAQPAAGGTVTINGQATTTSNIPLGAAGTPTPVSIVVSESGINSGTYTVFLNRASLAGNNSLQSLTVSPGTLAPLFSADTTDYTVNLPATLASNVTNVTVTPTLQDTTSSMTVNGQAATSGQTQTTPLPAPGSNSFINIVITAQDKTQKIYSVNVIRAALAGNNNLQNLTVSSGTLTPLFNASTLSYKVNVGSNVAKVTVSANKADPNAVMSDDVTAPAGTASGQATIQLGGPGTTTPVLINMTAPNGSSKTYRIDVTRTLSSNNNLSALTVRVGTAAQTLSPTFAPNTTNYTVNVGSGVASVNVSATKSDPNAVLSGSIADPGTGQATGQAPIQLGGPGTATPVTITVTAPNGIGKTYIITLNRAALASNNNLQNLTVSPGSLSPTFDANTTAYTVNVASDVTSVTVTATLQDTNATMMINGQGVSSGQASSINLGAEGSSTNVTIVVTAPNGSQKTYTITMNRATAAAPPAPASAPDLIAQDDSGFLPGNDADNTTNVNTPRFQISPPGAGETPNLYVDRVKVDATFDQGANTLKPTAALSDGKHTITYTVANAGGESLPSPSLPVTIDTVAP